MGGCFPVVALWIMDTRYLHLERHYITLYSEVLSGNKVKDFDLNYRPYVSNVDLIWRVAWSWSVSVFYGFLLAIMMALLVILFCRG